MPFIRNTDAVDNIRQLPDRPTISATSLKTKFDQIGEDLQDYLNNNLLNQLESTTPGSSGAENIGSSPISGVSGTTVHEQLSDISVSDSNSVKLTGNQTVSGVKTFTSSPVVPIPTGSTQASNKGYADTLDSTNVHLTGNETVAGIKTFTESPVVPTPTSDMQAATRKFVTDSLMDIVVPTLPEGAVTNQYLGSDVKIGSNALLHRSSTDVVTEINLKADNETAYNVTFTKVNGKTTQIVSTLGASQMKQVDFAYDSNGKVSTITTNENWRTVTATMNRGSDGTVSSITKVVT